MTHRVQVAKFFVQFGFFLFGFVALADFSPAEPGLDLERRVRQLCKRSN